MVDINPASKADKEPTAWEVVVATIKKYASFLGDPRTLASILAVVAVLRMLKIVDDRLSDSDIATLLNSAQGLLVALATFVTVLGSIVAVVVTLVKGWTDRPSRGLAPWLKSKTQEPTTVTSTATISTTTVPPDVDPVG